MGSKMPRLTVETTVETEKMVTKVSNSGITGTADPKSQVVNPSTANAVITKVASEDTVLNRLESALNILNEQLKAFTEKWIEMVSVMSRVSMSLKNIDEKIDQVGP